MHSKSIIAKNCACPALHSTFQNPELSGRALLAARLRLCEKKILSATMDAVRRRLAPIRGIPTKSGGMADPNADIKEVFDFIDELPRKPAQLLDCPLYTFDAAHR